jgi:hypothetical protein
MLTMSDGGNVSIRVKEGKIILRLIDNGGLDMSPPDGAEISLDKDAAFEVAKELDVAAKTVIQYSMVSLEERKIKIGRSGGVL